MGGVSGMEMGLRLLDQHLALSSVIKRLPRQML